MAIELWEMGAAGAECTGLGKMRNTQWGRRLKQRLIALSLLAVILAMPLAEARIYPALLGTREYVNQGLGKFPKWLDMLARWQDSAPCEGDDCTMAGWDAIVASLRGKDLRTQLDEVNARFNDVRYLRDTRNWGREDYWETPYQFLKRRGDCEDYAIAKFMALKAAGVRPENMRILALEDMQLKTGHAVLVVYDGETPLLLDNQIKAVVPLDSVPYYRPIYSINETAWWRHVPPTPAATQMLASGNAVAATAAQK